MSNKPALNLDQAAAPGLPRRLAAILYDSLLVFGLLLLGSILVTLPMGLLADGAGSEALTRGLIQLWCVIVPPAFFIYFWCKGGQTLGMRSWRLMLVTSEGQPVGVRAAALRALAALLSWGALGLGFLWVLFDPQKLAWHDRLSNTRLVELEKPSSKP